MKIAIVAGCIVAGGLLALPARAQDAPGGAARSGVSKPLSYVLTQWKKSSGATLLCSTSLAQQNVNFPREPATLESLEASLDLLVKSLPKGAIWAKLMLPAPPAGRMFKGDDLAAYAIAQSRLFGTAGGVDSGTVEVLSKKLPVESAAPIVQALGLQPVYVICNPNSTGSGMADFASLSDTEKQAWADRQAQQLLTLPPEQQMQAMGQMFQQAGLVFGNLMKSMTPEQRRGLFQNLGSMMGSMGGPGTLFLAPGGGR